MKYNNQVHEAIGTYGVKSVSEMKLLQAIGITEDAARNLMERAQYSLGQIAKMSIRELTAIKGITPNKAATLTAAIEIGRRRNSESAAQKKQITSSLDAYDILYPHMRDLTQEAFYLILLDRRSKVLRVECIHLGGMSAMVVDPKVVFQKALEYKASCIILSHNHPSGAASPSIEDIRLTEKIKQAGDFLDIKVLDHIIIGDGTYYGFADEGKM